MKYWYLKGADVIGPLSVEEIVKDEEFSGDTLVCPEPESANTEAWQSADQYIQDFGYYLNPGSYSGASSEESAAKPDDLQTSSAEEVNSAGDVSLSAIEDIALVEEKPEEVLFEPKSIIDQDEDPSGAEYTARHKFAEVEQTADEMEETIHARSPLNASMDDNLLDEIPACAVLSEVECKIEESLANPTKEEKGEEDEMVFNEESILLREETSSPKQVFDEEPKQKTAPAIVVDGAQSLGIKPEETAANKQQNPGRKILKEAVKESELKKIEEKKPEPEEAVISLDTFTGSAAVVRIDPSLAEESGKAVDHELEPLKIVEDEHDILAMSDEEEEERSSPNHGVLSMNHQADNGLLSVQDSVNNQFIKAAPTTTGKILSSSDGRVTREKTKRNDLIYIMVIFMFVLIVVASMMMFTSEKNREDNASGLKAQASSQTAQAQHGFAMEEPVSRSVIQGIDEGMVSPEVPTEPVKTPELTQSDGAATVISKDLPVYSEKLVRNYMLKSGETIEQYLNKLYGSAYQIKWGGNPFYGDIYIVEFFAAKVRSEPIRYMFSVDTKSGAITGMDNSSVELLDK